jgi:hypothetical protein
LEERVSFDPVCSRFILFDQRGVVKKVVCKVSLCQEALAGVKAYVAEVGAEAPLEGASPIRVQRLDRFLVSAEEPSPGLPP